MKNKRRTHNVHFYMRIFFHMHILTDQRKYDSRTKLERYKSIRTYASENMHLWKIFLRNILGDTFKVKLKLIKSKAI